MFTQLIEQEPGKNLVFPAELEGDGHVVVVSNGTSQQPLAPPPIVSVAADLRLRQAARLLANGAMRAALKRLAPQLAPQAEPEQSEGASTASEVVISLPPSAKSDVQFPDIELELDAIGASASRFSRSLIPYQPDFAVENRSQEPPLQPY
jgi:hypothetical protein